MLIAVDPGNVRSAYVVWDGRQITDKGLVDNEVLRGRLIALKGQASLVIEMIASYGMAVGYEVFDTCVWIGRFTEIFGGNVVPVFRKDIKMHLCHSMKANDANIRRAILDRCPSTGGGACPQVGTKLNPGPLFGVKKDIWAALAVLIYFLGTQARDEASMNFLETHSRGGRQ